MTADNWRASLPTWDKCVTTIQQSHYIRGLLRDAGKREAPTVIVMDEFRPRYVVDGRRRNGSLAGQRTVRWLLAHVWLVLRDTVLSILFAVLALFFGEFGPRSSFRRDRVHGAEGSAGVRFADSVRENAGRLTPRVLYVALSPERVWLCEVSSGAQPRLVELWSGAGSDVPVADTETRSLRWQDGSTVVLAPENWQANRQWRTIPGGQQ